MDKKRQYLLDCGIKCAWHNKTVDEFTNDADALGCSCPLHRES